MKTKYLTTLPSLLMEFVFNTFHYLMEFILVKCFVYYTKIENKHRTFIIKFVIDNLLLANFFYYFVKLN